MTAPTDTDATNTITVAFASGKGTLTVVARNGATVEEVVKDALAQLGRQGVKLDGLAFVVNSKDADLTDEVKDGDNMAVAGTLSNG